MIDHAPKIKIWTAEAIEQSAIDQIHNVASLPFVEPHIAVMPDAHWGIGATVGSVIPTTHAIIPAAVGVDLACGMMAAKTTLLQAQLPGTLRPLFIALEAAIPVGNNHWLDGQIPLAAEREFHYLARGYHDLISKHPAIEGKNLINQVGTLGGGNHFVELNVDTDDFVWLMLHSGSRGVGNRIGRYFIEKAKEAIEKMGLTHLLPHKDLAYLIEGEPLFTDYVKAMQWAQDYASLNRRMMMEAALRVLRDHVPTFSVSGEIISCHHNYVAREKHFDQWLWITRKGAINASEGTKGIIPGSMGTPSFIVEGLGHPDSLRSSSHGAGRAMSRGAAKLAISMEQHAKDTEDIMCRKDSGVLDESPKAYKNIHAVMEAQKELTRPLAELHPVLCLKG